MDRLVKQLKDYQVGLWCKRAAWIIAIFGLINFVLVMYSTILQYNLSDYNPMTPLIFSDLLRSALVTVPGTIFQFFILYAAGVAINHMLGIVEIEDKHEEQRDDDGYDEDDDNEE